MRNKFPSYLIIIMNQTDEDFNLFVDRREGTDKSIQIEEKEEEEKQ